MRQFCHNIAKGRGNTVSEFEYKQMLLTWFDYLRLSIKFFLSDTLFISRCSYFIMIRPWVAKGSRHCLGLHQTLSLQVSRRLTLCFMNPNLRIITQRSKRAFHNYSPGGGYHFY